MLFTLQQLFETHKKIPFVHLFGDIMWYPADFLLRSGVEAVLDLYITGLVIISISALPLLQRVPNPLTLTPFLHAPHAADMPPISASWFLTSIRGRTALNTSNRRTPPPPGQICFVLYLGLHLRFEKGLNFSINPRKLSIFSRTEVKPELYSSLVTSSKDLPYWKGYGSNLQWRANALSCSLKMACQHEGHQSGRPHHRGLLLAR